MKLTGQRSDQELASSLAARAREIEAKLAEIEAAMVLAAGDIECCERVGVEGTNLAVERVGEQAVHARLLTELATVRRAEAKLALGSDGCCDECGEVIPPERLEALPWAVRCVDCAG